MGRLTRGAFVQNMARNQGVIESVADEGTFAYVHWFVSYDLSTGQVHSFLEYVEVTTLTHLPETGRSLGLDILRTKIIR